VNKYLIYTLIAVIALAVGVGAWYYVSVGSGGEKVLKVGTSPDFPPFEYVDKNGNIVGIDIDLVKALASKLGYKVEIVSIDFDGLIQALKSGKIDLIAAGMTITEERSKEVSFTIPYWDADQAILVKTSSGFKPSSLSDLAGKTVGVQTGTTAEELVNDFVNKSGADIEVKSYSSYVLAVTDLENGRVDAVIIDVPVAKMFASKYGDLTVSGIIKTGEHYGLAVRKDDTELLNSLNKGLEKFLKSQEWQQIINKYFSG
jgi:polar amino acid transport system substrate-binding protein